MKGSVSGSSVLGHRAVAVGVLVLVTGAGWLLAEWLVPGQERRPLATQAAPAADAPKSPPSSQPLKAPEPLGAPGTAGTLKDLQQRQAQVSQEAGRVVPSLAAAPSGTAGQVAPLQVPAAAQAAASDPALAALRARHERQMRAMREIQSRVLPEIMAVPAGDTKRMMAVMKQFDEQMRAAGAPGVIDMDKLRQILEGTARMQDIQRQLLAESQKGRAADAARVSALSQQMAAAQAALPKSYVDLAALQKALAPR